MTALRSVRRLACRRLSRTSSTASGSCARVCAESNTSVIGFHDGRIDVVVHNAGLMAFGPAEACTADQFAELYDINVLSAQRVNRAALPQMRRQREGLVIWMSASGIGGGALPYQSPIWRPRPGWTRSPCNMRASSPAGASRPASSCPVLSAAAPVASPGVSFPRTTRGPPNTRPGRMQASRSKSAGLRRDRAGNADPGQVAGAIASVVDTPFGERPFRVHVDPSDDGAAVAFGVIDRVRNEVLNRVGLSDLTKPRRGDE